jgi:DNA-binding transcriptional ArsR family regulator
MPYPERIFEALASPARREILQLLKDGERSAGDIAAQFDMTAPSVSRHLALLRAAELIVERRAGNRIYYRLESERLALVLGDFLSSVCPTQVVQRRRRRSSAATPENAASAATSKGESS